MQREATRVQGEAKRALKICIHKSIGHRCEMDNLIQQGNNMKEPVDQVYEANIEYQINRRVNVIINTLNGA